MHILIMPAWYPSKDRPTNGSFFAEQAQALARYGHTVSVAALFNDLPSGLRIDKTNRGEAAEYAVHFKPLPLHLTYFRVLRAYIRLFRTEFKDRRPDILHVHSFKQIKYARVLKRLYNIPLVVTEHVTWFERGAFSPRQLEDIRRDYAAADAIVAVSTGLAGQIRPYCGGKEIRVIPNLVNESFFHGGLRSEPKGRFGFISVGALEHKKGMDVLLRAFAGIAEQHPDVTLTICGGGSEAEALERLSRELGISSSVTFTGPVSRQEVSRRLRENQIFVLPSRTETFGVVYVEAMACGLPIVMTKTNAWEILARPETGLAVEIDDVDALGQAMESVMDRYGQYDPQRISALCADSFSEKAICEKLTALYEETVSSER